MADTQDMPVISKITLPTGTTYEIKDDKARSDIANLKITASGGIHYLGTTTTVLSDGATTNPISISGTNVSASSGDIAIYGEMEFIYSDVDKKWHEFGSTGSLKALAFVDKADVSVKGTPSGSVGLTANTATATGRITYVQSVAYGSGTHSTAGTFSGTSGNVSVVGTPSGTISVGSGVSNYTPAGSLSGGAISVSLNTATKYVATNATGGGSVTDGSAASCTLPVFTTSVSDETLTLGWSDGSFTPNTPTAVTLPTFSSQTIGTGVKSATISTQPTFTGTGADLVFTGNELTSSGEFTPSGSVKVPPLSSTTRYLSGSFTGNELTSTGSATASKTTS